MPGGLDADLVEATIAWSILSLLLGGLFVVSLGSDVWEAYLSLFVASVIAQVATAWWLRKAR